MTRGRVGGSRMQEGEEEGGKGAGTDGKLEGNRREQGNETTV